MRKAFPRIRSEETVRAAVRRLLAAGWTCGPVLDARGTPVGTFGRRDLLRAVSQRTGGFYSELELAFALLRGDLFNSASLRRLLQDSWDAPVDTVMEREPTTVAEDTPLERVARRFLRDDAEVAIVVRGGRAVGALRPRDVLAALSRRRSPPRRRA